MQMFLGYIKFVVVLIGCVSCLSVVGQKKATITRERIDLAGNWQLQLDTDAVGIPQHWHDRILKETIQLPGSLEEQGKGIFVTDSTTNYLSQTWKYSGVAWYQKEIVVPDSWEGKRIRLFIERTKATQVWLDDQWMGACSVLSAPQVYEFKHALTPGKHTLTIRVDNSPALTPVGGSHALSVHTQTNWNGVIGELFLEAVPELEINRIKLIPQVNKRTVEVKLNLKNNINAKRHVRIELQAATHNTLEKRTVKAISLPLQLSTGDSILTINYPL